MEEIELHLAVLEKLGIKASTDKLAEECCELGQAALKWKVDPTPTTYEHICEEMADVEIMLDRMKLVMGKDNIAEWKKSKLYRLEQNFKSGDLK